MSTNPPKAYSYIRFSTPEQATGDSFRRQAELSNRYAEDHGLILDTSLSLCDSGLSDFTGQNRSKGALALFLNAVESGRLPAGSFLLVESLDRLSRDTMSEQMSLFIGLINAGLTVVTLADSQSYSKTTINTDLSKLMLSLVVMMRAHEESLSKSRRLKAAWEAKRKRAPQEILTARCPSWLNVSVDRLHFVVNPERVEVIRRIYHLGCMGQGVARIARTLNCDEVPTWTRSKS